MNDEKRSNSIILKYLKLTFHKLQSRNWHRYCGGVMKKRTMDERLGLVNGHRNEKTIS